MLRIAVQSKGRLFDDTMNLLAEADIKVSASKRTLLVQASNLALIFKNFVLLQTQ